MSHLNQKQIEKERLNGKILMIINIMKSEIARINRIGLPITDDEAISEWSELSLEEVKKLRDICFILNLDNIIYDLASYEKANFSSQDESEELLLNDVSERINDILETYLYPFDIIKYAFPFELIEDINVISKKNIKDYSLVEKYSEKLYLDKKHAIETD